MSIDENMSVLSHAEHLAVRAFNEHKAAFIAALGEAQAQELDFARRSTGAVRRIAETRATTYRYIGKAAQTMNARAFGMWCAQDMGRCIQAGGIAHKILGE